MVAPKLRFKEFSGDWEKTTLGEVVKFSNGRRIPLSESDRQKRQGTYRYYGASGVIDYIDDYIFDGQYILIGEDGANILTRSSTLAFVVEGKFWVNNHAHIFQSKNGDNTFLATYLESLNYEKYNSGTAQPKLNLENLKKVIVANPLKEEQTKIASFLSAVDEKINQLTQKHELLSYYKQGMMQKLFSQQIRFKADDGSEFGEWEEVALSEIAVITMGSSPKSENYNEILNGLPLLQGNADIKNRKSLPRLYTSEITRKCNVGDILLSVRAPVGFVATSEHYACIGRGLCSIKANPNYLQGFIYQWLLSKENSWGSLSQGSTFESVNSDQIKNLSIQIPCLEEQTKIANFLSAIDQKIEVVAQQIEQAKTWKKGLLQQMFI
ncbi:restriction endonuclease subunit S [Acinetobacter baumannii]|nr:restriction endonuclease subunit S [Acinetobacter baumannii]